MTLASEVHEKARLTVVQVQGRAGGRLDYSEQSLAPVEELLDEALQYQVHSTEPVRGAVPGTKALYV